MLWNKPNGITYRHGLMANVQHEKREKEVNGRGRFTNVHDTKGGVDRDLSRLKDWPH